MKSLCIMPVYNQRSQLPALLEKCKSGLACDKLLIVDDGSDDGSEKIIRDSGFAYLRFERQTERDHFLKQWAGANQDISMTLAKNHAPLRYIIKYQMKWFWAELSLTASEALSTIRRLKRWMLNIRTWFKSSERKEKIKKIEPTKSPEKLTPQTTSQ